METKNIFFTAHSFHFTKFLTFLGSKGCLVSDSLATSTAKSLLESTTNRASLDASTANS